MNSPMSLESFELSRDHIDLLKNSQEIDLDHSDKDMNLLESLLANQKIKSLTLKIPTLPGMGTRLMEMFPKCETLT